MTSANAAVSAGNEGQGGGSLDWVPKEGIQVTKRNYEKMKKSMQNS